jgi:hypothetical protein
MTSLRVKYKGGGDAVERRKNRTKAGVRTKVEWPFRILKRVFGYTKVCYRGLKKNHEWLLAAFALVNLYQHRKRLVSLGGVLSLEAGIRPSEIRHGPENLAICSDRSGNFGSSTFNTTSHRKMLS